MEDITNAYAASLLPSQLVLYAYALSGGFAEKEKLAALFRLRHPPVDAATAWEMYANYAQHPPLEAVCDEYGLDEFSRFAVSLALAAELNENIRAALTLLGGDLTCTFAARVFSASAEEATVWLVRWLANEHTVRLAFEKPRELILNRGVLRFLLGFEDKLPHHLDRLAGRVPAAFTWDDLVLPAEQKQLLRHICHRVRHQRQVYADWGFGKIVPYGRGVRALFTGPPGTGKTMAAQVVARELGTRLYRVDLSALVSKYIGETEKNLDDVFREAALSNGILFFDEADALFGKRSEQRDSNDKYANMQTGFLLQRVEDFDGVVLLATNFVTNLDAAFTRRIQVRVDFPAPDEAARRAIWSNLLNVPVPLAEDIDADFLAESFELTGAEIKNVVLSAAFFAAAEGGGITMERLIRALAMEYAKAGKILSEKDLGPYADALPALTQLS